MTATTIREALSAVMADVGAVGKDRQIEQGPARYKYRSIESMLSKIQPAFVKHGVVCVPRVQASEYRDGTTRNGGSTREATLTVQFDFVGPDGSTLSAVTIGEATDTSDKASNKAMTAAFKYALLMVLAIPSDEHDEQDAERVERGPAPRRSNPVAEAKKRLLGALGGDKAGAEAIWKTVVGDGEWSPDLEESMQAEIDKHLAATAPFEEGS